MVVLGGMGNVWGVILGAVLLSFVPEFLRFTVEPVQRQLFGRMLIEPEVIRMLIFGFALVLVMILRPGGLLPSAVRKRSSPRATDRRQEAPDERASRSDERQQALRRHRSALGVSFSVPRGQIFGLIGPNGAGKTTLFNLLTGLYPLDRGFFLLDGGALAGMKPDRVAARGIARTFQNIRLFANLSALENVMIGRHVRTRAGVLGAVLRDPATRAEEAGIERRGAELLDYVGIRSRANEAAGSLPYGDQRRLEIARALATDPVLLALDEPAAE